MVLAIVILAHVGIYLSLGVLVGIPFVWRGVEQIDPAASRASLGFRILILPGTIALWPLMATKWLRAPKTGGHT